MPTIQLVEAPIQVSWAEARKLVEKVRSGARAWLELGAVLEELRAEFFDEGRTVGLKRGTLQPVRAPHDAAHGEKGWQAKVREELGISDDTARRWIDRARYVRMLATASSGAPVKYLTAGEEKTFRPDAEARARAEELLDAALAGDVKPSAAWAGVVGEGRRREAQGGEAKRAKVQPGKQIRDAMHSLAKWMPSYEKLPLNERSILAQTALKLDLEALLAPLWEDVAKVEIES